MAPLAQAFVRVRPQIDRQEFRREVDQTLKSIGGNVKVALDTQQVGRDLTALRAEIGKLRGKDLTINVDVTKAYVDVVTLKEELQQLGRLRPSVRADADTTAAMARLAALTAEVRRLDGLNPTVRPDVDDSGVRAVGDAAQSSSSSISGLAAAGVALAPAIVPSAAAVTQAIAGITQMAIGAAGGIGVIALASVGVVGALKAMSAADDQATQSTVSLAGNQLRVAAASDTVRSAQASLANTVTSAAEAQRRASQAITDSDRQETDAHRTLAQAQQAVTQARIDAARAAQDLTSRVANNAIDQRQATLDTAKAEEALAAARANAGPGADNSRTVQEAQIALDRQRQRVIDLETEHKRLAEDKQKSDRQGIDGSTQVVSALDRVRQATEAVHKAEQSSADARAAYTAQARQSAFSIAQAQQSVISAQRGLQQATEQTATAGGAAMLALRQSMADLSPEGQRFTEFLYRLKPAILDLRRTAEAGLLPGAQAGIEALLPLMPDAIGYTSRYATAVGNLAQRAGEAFAQPYWRGFARDLVGSSIPAMETAAGSAYNMALGVSALVRASLPLSKDFGGGLLRFSQDFAHWALTVQNTQGFRDFMDYIHTEGPIVADTIGAVARAAFRVVEAAAPIGGVTLTAIRLLADTINALPVPVVTALAVGIGSVVLATKGLAIWATIGPVVAGAINGVGAAFRGMQIVSAGTMFAAQAAMQSAATAGAGAFGQMFAGIQGGARVAGSAVGGLAGMIGPAGMLGIALAGATVLAVIYAQKSAEQKTRIDGLKTALLALGDAYRQSGDLSSQSVKDVITHNDQLSELVRNTKLYGLSVDQVVKASSGDHTQQQQVIAALDARKRSLQNVMNQEIEAGNVHGLIASKAFTDAQNETDRINEHEKGLKGEFKQLNDNADVTRILTREQGRLSDETLRLTPAQKSLNDALRVVGDTSSTVTEKIKAATTAYEAQWKAEMDVTEAQEAAARATDTMTETITRNQTQLAISGGSLDLNTAKTRDQRQAILDSRDAIEAATLASVTRYQADVAGGLPMDQATQRHHDRITALIDEATKSGANKEQVRLLVEQYGRVPGDVETNIKTNGLPKVYEDLRNLKAAQMALDQGITPEEAIGRLNRDAYYRQIYGGGRAGGGPIYGPGGPTADMVPAIGPGGVRYQLSDGEWITRAKAVDYYGGDTMAAINAMAIPRETLQQMIGRASGGPVFHGPPQHGGVSHGPGETWPFTVDVSKTKIPKLTAGLGGGGGNIGWQAMWNQLHAALPWVQLFSAFRPGDMAESGLSYHASGRAIDVTPDMRVVNWARAHWGTNLKELIHTPAGARQVWNGRDHVFTGEALRAAHYDHVHLAMAKGGLVNGLPVRSFDSGGWLPPKSATVAVNGTNDWEPVGSPGGGGRTIQIIINPPAGASTAEIVAEVKRDLAWEMA